ncbi:MAG: flagellar assembly protein FliH [Spirochaetaceae bacterium]|jgi:flagellar assembly protein FliH|nr:flagellar assembly protein FliH [Spirochaetaceae bacterium]
MSRVIFRSHEIVVNDMKMVIEPPLATSERETQEDEALESLEVERYDGPTVEDLRREAELFKSQWNAERDTMILSAKVETERIIKEAEETAAELVQQGTEQVQTLQKDAKVSAERMLAEGRRRAQDMETAAQTAIETRLKEAEQEGLRLGKEAGFTEGKAEVDRLINRIHTVLERAQDKRSAILIETEQQVVDLVLLIARKVVKIISEQTQEVVIANVKEALRKVKGRGDIIIRINTADLQLTTEHTEDFIQTLEGGQGIQIQEDSSVDKGGCIIETDFGDIDARIASQLAELEAKILEMIPMRLLPKPGTSQGKVGA